MFNLTKAQAMAVGVMLGLGVAAPILSWTLSEPRARLGEVYRMGIDPAAMQLVAPTIDLPEPVNMDELLVAPGHHMLAESVITVGEEEPAPEKRCYYHQSETLATGAVLICDVPRSESGQKRIFVPADKPKQVAPR
jgi:hypothetical protein